MSDPRDVDELSEALFRLGRIVAEGVAEHGHHTVLPPGSDGLRMHIRIDSVDVKLEISRTHDAEYDPKNHVHPMVVVHNRSEVDAYVLVTRFGSGGVSIPHQQSKPVPISGADTEFVDVTNRDPEYDIHAFATIESAGGHLVKRGQSWWTDV